MKWHLLDGVDWMAGAAQIGHTVIPKDAKSQKHGRKCMQLGVLKEMV
jgi:hypothetical protein